VGGGTSKFSDIRLHGIPAEDHGIRGTENMRGDDIRAVKTGFQPLFLEIPENPLTHLFEVHRPFARIFVRRVGHDTAILIDLVGEDELGVLPFVPDTPVD